MRRGDRVRQQLREGPRQGGEILGFVFVMTRGEMPVITGEETGEEKERNRSERKWKEKTCMCRFFRSHFLTL
jgi:hypothetical protein